MLRFIVLALLYFWAVVNVDESMMSIGLYIAIPSAFILSFWCTTGKLCDDKCFKIFIIFLLWVAFTWLGAADISVATKQMKRLLGVFLMSSAVCNLATDKRNISWLYALYVVLFIVALNYARTHIVTIKFDIGHDRLDDERLNANILASYTFYATFALFALGNLICQKVYKKIFHLLFLVMIPLSFVIAILTASRQVLLVQIPIIAILLYIKYIKSASIKTKFGFIVAVCLIALVSMNTIIDTYDNSFLKQRSENGIQDDGRLKVLNEAIDVGCENVFIGVGPGNFILHSSQHIFSHCSYTEAFANTGIMGLILYLYLIGKFLKNQWQYYRATKEIVYLAFLSFGIIYVFYNFFYVFYSDLWLMSFFLFVAHHSNTIWINHLSTDITYKESNIG
ncbi:O-antigen ligase family protein [Bacteroides thetaiotaomicron]|uniref:O-antigen ligase family protein n=1 Tax=Bacteroides thetaiotaomicron TaxID=818 RepID=UPI0018975E83|nr:O-antigen ligase family protein [Bacteroides thetaiotaomicron]MCE8949967.1 O-antigen ligase family protein [Bacteroides thetaiotaomicron]MCE8966900.1 O-antigen ligase family protein [Bacteroides thetaiotaomicron]